MKMPLLVFTIFLGVFLTGPVTAAEDPDELYREGRFTESEKAYAERDMDHPKDVRYRYNRGCAAYQNSDYQGARSAFSSVLRRTEDRAVHFKAAYNLGNAAYRQGDFESAVASYRQAIVSDPSDESARYNLELALRALERQKKEKAEKKDLPSEKGKEESKEREEKKESGKGENSEDKVPDSQASKKDAAQERDQEGERAESPSDREKEAQEKKDERGNEVQAGEQEPRKDLSGELKPLQDMKEQDGKEQDGVAAVSKMNRKKAEALLDNIKENRSRYLRFQVPEDKKQGPASGKDW